MIQGDWPLRRLLFSFPQPLVPFLHPLAGTVQGLGLLAATLMAVTGLILFFGMAPDGSASATVSLARQIHRATAPVMWTYLAAHVAFALL